MPRFTYSPTVPYDGSIGELIARRGRIAGDRARDVGNIQAQAALQRGQAWGNAVGSIGDVISRGMQAYQQEKQDAPIRALNLEAAQTRLAGEKAALANEQAAGTAQAQLTRRDAAFVGLFDKFPDGNIPLKELSTIYGPRDGLTVARGLQAYRALEAGEVEDPYQDAVRIGAAFKALKSPALQQAFWPQVQQAAVKAGLVTPEQLTPEYTDEVPDALIAWGSGKTPEGALKLERVEITNADGSKTFRWVQPSAGLEVSGGAPPKGTPPTVGSFEDYVTAKYGPRPTPQQITQARTAWAGMAREPRQPGEQTPTPTARLNATRALRNDFVRETASMGTIQTALGQMQSSLQAAKAGDMAAGSQGVLVTFQKILDPTSVVRESEYARSASGLSLLSRMEGALQTLTKGGAGVPVRDLESFVRLAEQFARNQAAHAATTKTQIEGMAKEFGLDPSFMTREFGPDAGGGADAGEFDFDPATGQLVPRGGR